jgi:hypothetical protein
MLKLVLYGDGPMLRSHRVSSLDDRVKLLRALVWKGAQAFDPRVRPEGGLQDPEMRRLGLSVVQQCPARDDMCELGAIFEFVARNIRYTGDIAGKDTFQSALRTLQYAGGDCDDHSVLNAVLAMENGFDTKFRITSNTGASWDHIYTMAGVPKHAPRRWVALDTTLGTGRFGREPPRAKNRDFDVGDKT